MRKYDVMLRNYLIMANENLDHISKQTNKLIDLIEFYTQSYSRTFVILFGLNFPKNIVADEGNLPIQVFMDRFTEVLPKIRTGVIATQPDKESTHVQEEKSCPGI
jgi:hypothetical protein